MASKAVSALAPTERFRLRKRLWAALGLFIAGGASLNALAEWRDTHALLINSSESLPNWAFVIHKTATPVRGEYVFFVPPAAPLVVRHFGAKKQMFGKIVYGMPGDLVEHRGADVIVLSQRRVVIRIELSRRRREGVRFRVRDLVARNDDFIVVRIGFGAEREEFIRHRDGEDRSANQGIGNVHEAVFDDHDRVLRRLRVVVDFHREGFQRSFRIDVNLEVSLPFDDVDFLRRRAVAVEAVELLRFEHASGIRGQGRGEDDDWTGSACARP